ncbi:MAG TPA: aminotransferase class IV [Candidatus Acidoferrales bacterium]|nr:aminotransferase class IV [Candidatus Acidoferrales bacterium]
MIHRHVFHNDRLLPIEQVRLSPGQAGLLSGWGLFTTLRVSQGELFAYERHWRRLEKDARRTHLPFPFDAEIVRGQLHEVLRANHVTEGTARIYAVYNKTGFWQSDEPAPQVDLILYSAGLPSYKEPVRLSLREHGRHAASPLAGVKVTSWLNNVWNLAEAQQSGFDEVVLLNERGEVAECTAANIFCVRQGRVLTPPLSSGCLEGVTRGVLLEIASSLGLQMSEQTLTPEDLYSAEEVFISSTNRNLLGIGEIAGHHFANVPGPVTRKLEDAMAAYVAEYVSKKSAQRSASASSR